MLLQPLLVASLAAHVACSQVDYIIIGAGPAGLVLAESLSRNSSVSIVVLEAGPDATNSSEINTPAYGPDASSNPKYIWDYYSQPDVSLGGRTPSIAQGRVLGGGTGVNYMAYCRGAPSVFDGWANISGIPELAWSSLYEYFKATVHYQEEELSYDPRIDSSAYGQGPVEVTAVDDTFDFDLQFIDALSNGLNLSVTDLNAGNGLGVSSGPATIRASNRTRDYALQAYGWQLARRSNVQLLHGAWVTKIGFTGKTATNVTYTSSDELHTLQSKEIILSGGAINSPKVLLLSGVGPAAELENLGIEVILDQPYVGTNLIDHHFSVIEYEVVPEVQTIWQYTENASYIPIAESEYKLNGSGPLGATNGAPFAIYRVPDHVFEGVNDTYHTSLPADQGQLLFQYVNGALVANSPNISLISPFVALVKPQAKGTVRLNSSNYQDAPLIFSNYYGSPGDKAAILYGYKLLRQILTSPGTSSRIVTEVFPGANRTTDEELWEGIVASAQSFHHPMGTVALGKVLDDEFRIKGLGGIRVIDTSAFPTAPTCHLQADVYAFALAAADVVKRTDTSM